jgi:diguanylate cyclase (GGDEF)-like protein
VAGLLAVAVATMTPGTDGHGWGYLAVALGGAALSVTGARRTRSLLWAFVAVGQVVYLAADVTWTLMEASGLDALGSVADVLYLLQYLCLASALRCVVRARRLGSDRAALLDTALVSNGIGVLFLVFLVLPIAATGAGSALDRLAAVAYPAGDFVVLVAFVRLLIAGAVRNTAFWALVSSLTVMLLADTRYLFSVSAGVHYPGWLNTPWLLTYVVFGFASIHPSATTLTRTRHEAPTRVARGRIVLLGFALALPAVADEVAELTGSGRSAHVVLVGSLVGTTLVLVRLWGLLGSLEHKAEELATLAQVDALTGVPNRRSWDHELTRACAAAGSSHQPLVVAVVDFDHFKAYNDAHGHIAGDVVLKETAAAWQAVVDGVGVLARFGGEEFTVLLPDHRLDAAEPLLERLRAEVAAGQTCSIGVAVWDFTEDPAALLSRADEALYHAKRAGRDRVAVHDGTTTRDLRAPRRAGVESLLTTVFQPIVDLTTGEPAAYEALSRFSNGNPQEVFDRAVLHGTQASLEAAALRSALAGWRGSLPVSLNVSGATITSPEVMEALDGDLSNVVLELTESDSAASTPAVLACVTELRARGATIAVDDFGVGFSNIERVARLKPDLLKLDMSLVRGIDTNPMLQAVVRGCLAYVQDTGTALCAEGIETAGELDTLLGLGVRLGQGYLLGRPQPYEHYEGCTDVVTGGHGLRRPAATTT